MCDLNTFVTQKHNEDEATNTAMKHCVPQKYLSIPSSADALSLPERQGGSHSSGSRGPVLLPVMKVVSSPKPAPADVLASPNCSASACKAIKTVYLKMFALHIQFRRK